MTREIRVGTLVLTGTDSWVGDVVHSYRDHKNPLTGLLSSLLNRSIHLFRVLTINPEGRLFRESPNLYKVFIYVFCIDESKYMFKVPV